VTTDELTVKSGLFDDASSPISRSRSTPSISHQKDANIAAGHSRSCGKLVRTCAHANRQTMMDLLRWLPRTTRTLQSSSVSTFEQLAPRTVGCYEKLSIYYICSCRDGLMGQISAKLHNCYMVTRRIPVSTFLVRSLFMLYRPTSYSLIVRRQTQLVKDCVLMQNRGYIWQCHCGQLSARK